jgi:thioredoxin 1
MAEVSYVLEGDFDNEVIKSALPVLIDFTAVWCGPCKMVDPIIRQLADDWAGKVKVLKCDADQNPDLITSLGIMGIPTIMLFKDGKVVERVTGYKPKDQLINKMLPHL